VYTQRVHMIDDARDDEVFQSKGHAGDLSIAGVGGQYRILLQRADHGRPCHRERCGENAGTEP
jgi:hypothetical protein